MAQESREWLPDKAQQDSAGSYGREESLRLVGTVDERYLGEKT
jgi:hypothetical protein